MYSDVQLRHQEDCLLLQRELWPHIAFYDKQIEIVQSVDDNFETYVPAGNQLGKDFIAGYIILRFFLMYWLPDKTRNWVRIVTTSVKDDHLDVLWGEVGRYISSAIVPLNAKQGGCLAVNAHEIRHRAELELTGGNAGSYIKGTVTGVHGEGMQGHHAENTLLVIDEASGVDDTAYNLGCTWAKRVLIIGNPLPCQNFFYKGVKLGDLIAQ